MVDVQVDLSPCKMDLQVDLPSADDLGADTANPVPLRSASPSMEKGGLWDMYI